MDVDDKHVDVDDKYDETEQTDQDETMCEKGVFQNGGSSSPEGEAESLLHCTGKTLEEVFAVYRAYSAKYGFSVRRSSNRYNRKTNVVVQQLFVCSCEGNTRAGTTTDSRKIKRPRTGCNAGIKVKLNGEGVYEVVSHVIEHNHETVPPEHTYLLRSERQITPRNASFIRSTLEAGMRPIDSYNFLCAEAGGETLVGHTLNDHYNFISRVKMNAIESGDAQTLIDILANKADADNNFFYRVKLDGEGKLSNIFWRDAEMLRDYDTFGDVMVFDTTYRTNKYNLICAPFVGVNNHWRNCMFGCAFLSNEKEESFIWLFETFLKAMNGKEPDSLFTDQDIAMGAAIEKVFNHARHRLCTWHIHKNAISHFGKLKSDVSFQRAFKDCLRDSESEEEFIQSWNYMIDKFGLNDDSWFARLFELRHKWCNALNKDFFSAGFLSSQRSESTNKSISFRANKATSLTEFFRLFEHTTRRWKVRELEDEHASLTGVPDPRIRMHSLELHAIAVYTREMYKDFDNEYRKAMCSNVKMVASEEDATVYEVELDKRTHTVITSTHSKIINCSCRRIFEMKMLCFHMIRIMHRNSWAEIPDRYIFGRWTKKAKERGYRFHTEKGVSRNGLSWKDVVGQKIQFILGDCDESDDAHKVFEETLTELMNKTSMFRSHETVDGNDNGACSSNCNVLDPTKTKTKGRSKRIKSFLERGRKQRKLVNKEFGTTTP